MHVRAEAGIKLGKDYPAPLVGLTAGRDRALAALMAMRPSGWGRVGKGTRGQGAHEEARKRRGSVDQNRRHELTC